MVITSLNKKVNIFQKYSKVGTYNTETYILSPPSQNTYTYIPILLFTISISISILLLSIKEKEREYACCCVNK